MLSKMRQWRSYQRTFYSWNTDFDTDDLWERRFVEGMALSSFIVHALLPTQDSLDFRLSSLGSLMQEHPTKWHTFQIGVLEVLDLLACPGKEPGRIGFWQSIELPLAHSLPREQSCPLKAEDSAPPRPNHVPSG
jgi:hypothetical protein